MEEGASLRPFEGPGQAPIYRLSALDQLLWPPKPLLLHPPPPQKLKKQIPYASRVGVEGNLSNTWLECLPGGCRPLGSLWVLALRPVFLSLAHAQQEHSSEVWLTGRQWLLLRASLNAWPT